jgi:HAD superfamily hydrolase (TIGR01509 family)
MLSPIAIPNPLDAVIFDLDGLLLDSECVYERITREALNAMGFPMPASLYARMIGLPGPDCDVLLRETLGPDFSSDQFIKHFRALAEPHFAAGVPLKTGALEILDELDAHGVAKAIATSSSRQGVEIKLRGAGLSRRFEVIATATDVPRGKPHPDVFLEAARALGVQAAQCVALEDSHNGVRAAHAAGMAPIMVPDLLEPDTKIAALCVAVAQDLHEARRLLGLHAR